METSENQPLYQMNPQGRFSDRARDYAKYRPSYPSAAIDCLLAGLGNPSSLTAADIGAGTGISSRLLGDRGVKVVAIEPNLAMRKAAVAHPLVEFRDSSAEQTNLSDQSVDLVTCFQSFHWFDPAPTLKEFYRILKPKGQLAAIWNNRDRDDEFTAQYSQLIQVASKNKSGLRIESERVLQNSSWFPQISHFCFPFQQVLDREGLIGRSMSASYIPKEGEIYEQLAKNLKALYEKYRDSQGLVSLKYKTSVYLANS